MKLQLLVTTLATIGSAGAFVLPQSSSTTTATATTTATGGLRNRFQTSSSSFPTKLDATLIENWELTADGCITGQTQGHPEMNDGEIISTSPLVNPQAAVPASFVSTRSGSQYLLGTPRATDLPPPPPPPAYGMAAPPQNQLYAPPPPSPANGGGGGGGDDNSITISRETFLAGGAIAAVAALTAGVTTFLGDTPNGMAPPSSSSPSLLSTPLNPMMASSSSTSPAAAGGGAEFTKFTPGPAEPKNELLTSREVSDLFELWNQALKTGNPDAVAMRYADGAVLLPTKSDIPRSDYAGIRDYFVHFLEKKPTGRILESYISTSPGSAMDVGIYEFSFENGQRIRARYSFLYKLVDGQWKIKHHHSSGMPETPGQVISESEVRGLFNLWNDALLTGDSDVVTQRYAKGAVLLPTVSDIPRTTYAGIKDYFDHFLELKPKGKIIESYVSIGENWCKDVGIYEFLKGTDGTSVRARYSFVYVFEDGEWKISHHHSSLMPEELLAKAKKA